MEEFDFKKNMNENAFYMQSIQRARYSTNSERCWTRYSCAAIT